MRSCLGFLNPSRNEMWLADNGVVVDIARALAPRKKIVKKP